MNSLSERLALAAAEIEHLHRQSAGSTYSLHAGNLLHRRGFSVSPHPDRTCKLDTKTPSDVQFLDFIKANLDLLQMPDWFIGTWVNESNETEIDVVCVVESEFRALVLGLKAEQKYVFDLEKRVEIRVNLLNIVRAFMRRA